MLLEIQEAAKCGAELIELRLDFLARPPDLKRLLAEKPCPMIVAIRRPQDGGRWKGSEETRLLLLRQAVAAGFDYIDLETDVADAVPRFRDVKRIVSYHNLRGVPPDLEEIHRRMCLQDADVVKIAVRAETPADNLRLLALCGKSPKPTVAFCLGDLGAPSRILAGKFGAPFTYSAFNIERGIAPGILSSEEMTRVYRYNAIGPATRVYAVIGDPVAHSLSPLVHNAAFAALGLDCVLMPMRTPQSDLAETLKRFDTVPIEGYCVTLPLKESAAALASRRDAEVELTGAANTLVRRPQGGFEAYNTDCGAAVESLRAALAGQDAGFGLAGRSVLILGAGGAARAVAHGMQRAGALVTLCNRTSERAQLLAQQVGCRVVDWTARHTVIPDILINCTSVGMHPHLDEMPIHVSALRQGLWVFDIVYTPETTLLVREARERGCHVLTGVDMFVRQAALQFQLFTGKEPPLDLMRRVVKRALSPVRLKEGEDVAD